MEVAIQKAARSRYGFEHDIRAQIDRKTGAITLERYREVVDEVENEVTQLTVEDAQAYKKGAVAGDFIIDTLPPIDFGRVAAQTAKQVIVQKVRDAERNRQYEEYKEKMGTIVNGTVKRIEFGNVVLDIGKTEAVLRRDEIIPRESSKTATVSALTYSTSAAKPKARRFSFPAPVPNFWPPCSLRKCRKFMTASSRSWALPAIPAPKPNWR